MIAEKMKSNKKMLRTFSYLLLNHPFYLSKTNKKAIFAG
ncbi:hypothetical protein RV10_GL002268 [Enterococcus pallens]|nr:hypothetical protein RV10_GL002268 [Enterococcus pallens]